MTTASEADRERAETEAATWLVVLSEDEGDGELRARFEAWVAACPLNAELWARTERAYDLAGHVRPQAAQDARRLHVTSRTQPVSRRPVRPMRRIAGRIAMAAAAVVALAIFAPSLLIRLQADHLTATAEPRAVRLEDGTVAELGPETALVVNFTSGERRVRLLKGEAMFDVVPDASRPFRVGAGAVEVSVLGTAFDVRLEDDGVAVAVEHGHVRVSGREVAALDLRAGDWVKLQDDRPVERGVMPPGDVGARSRGELVVRDRPAGEVIDALRPWFGGRIIVWDEAFAAWRVSGLFDLRDPAGTLRALAAQRGGDIREITPWLLVVSSN